MSDYDEDEVFGNEQKYGDEFAAKERGGGDVLQGLLNSVELIEGTDAENMRVKSPEDRFFINLKKLFEDFGMNFAETRNFFVRLKENDGHNLRYRNALAMTLGYIATNRGKRLDKENFDEAVLQLEKDDFLKENGGVFKPDILRYARFIERLP